MLTVRLLERLALEGDDGPLEPPASVRARDLLAYLALNPGMHARSRVAARFWPDVLDESARTSLRTALVALRRALAGEAETLVAGREQIGLRDDVRVDVRAFASALADERLEEAVALGRGELLPGCDEDWAIEARAAHRDALAAALDRLASAAQAAGDEEAALRYAREQVALDGHAEEPARRLITLLWGAGRRSEALAAYERLRARLRELGIAPGAETRALVERLRADAGEPDEPPAREGDPPSPLLDARRLRSELLGREAELARLRAAWRRALEGEPQLVLLGGEPGIGKTRLAVELLREARADGALALAGRCREEPLAPYEPFAEALPEALALPASGDAGSDPGGARLRLFEGVAARLATASRERPVALLLDDLHWAERPTLLLLRHLIERGGAARLLIVGTYRESELARDHPLAATLAELRRDGDAERIRLGGLDAAATAALVAREAGGAATPELAAAVYDETRGNAFFVQEVARHLAESGAAGGIPESVREAVGRRLTRLSPEANRLLGLAAVAGPTFDAALLETAGDVAGDALLDALDEALAAALIREEAGAPGTYAFEHALVRETLYAEQGTLRRLRMHRRLADALAVADPGDARLEERAHHALEAAAAGGEVEAARIAYRAARAALEGLAYESAAALLERAVLALADAPEPELRSELLLALGEARLRSGDARSARDALGESADAAEACGRADLLARAALAYCGIGVYVGPADAGAVALLERALAGADDALRARLLARLAVQHYYDDPIRCDALSDEALALARDGDDPDALLDALSARHAARWRPDGLDERLALCDEMLAAADAHGRLEAKLQARNWRVVDELERGDMAAARREMHAHAELAEQLRLPAFLWYAPLWGGVLAALEGRREEAAALIGEAQALGERAQDPNAGMFGFIARWNVQIIYQHDDMLAFRAEAEAHRDASATTIAWDVGFTYYHAVTGETATARADLALIAADGLDALPRDANWFASMWELGEAVRVLGDTERAAELYALLLPYRARTVVVARGAAVLGPLELLLSRLATTVERCDEAIAHGEAGLAACERDGALGLAAHARFRLGAALAARGAQGDAGRAAALQAEARAAAEQLGIAHLS